MVAKRTYSLTVIVLLLWVMISALSCDEDSPLDPDDPGGNGGIDTIPPAAVMGLYARTPTASTMALVWVSPGDDGSTGQAASYDLRYSLDIITDQTWAAATLVTGLPAPKPAGNVETVVATGLPSGSRLHFALKTTDEAHNESALSNNAIDTTLAESTAPAALTDLRAKAISDTEFKLTWTAPGDDYMTGTATAYDARYSLDLINNTSTWNNATQVAGEQAPAPGGSPDSFVVTGLQAGTNYHFAIKTVDDVGNWSRLPNLCAGMALSNVMWVTPLTVNSLDDVSISFRASPTERTVVLVQQLIYIGGGEWDWTVLRHLVDDILPDGIHTEIWDTTDDDGNPINSGWFAEQVVVELYHGTTLIEQIDVRILI